jgi:tripartite-type tricarboxylate transporter receptor subunit TctC
MKKTGLMRAAVATLLAGVLGGALDSASAQEFAGKDVTMIVNYTPGGPTDIEARLVAQFLPKHLQGVRSIVVRNVGGAGGAIGVNTLGVPKASDRLNISFFTWDPMDQLINNSVLHVRYNDLKFVAGFQQVSLVYARKDTPPGLTRPVDIVKAPLVRSGFLSPTNHATVRQRLAFDLLGVKYESIPGYRGLKDIEVAIMQGDINATNNSLPGWYATIKPNLADKGIVIPLFQYDCDTTECRNGRSPDLPDVMSFTEVYKEVKGPTATPAGQKWEALQLLTRIMDSMYRTVFMPPNAPPAAVEEMRVAFDKLSRDPEFMAAYEKIVKTRPHMLVGAKGDAIIQSLGKVSPEMLTFFRGYVADVPR